MQWASLSQHTILSHDSLKSAVSYLVHFSRYFKLSKWTSGSCQALSGGCLVIYQNGRKASISTSIGEISKLSLE